MPKTDAAQMCEHDRSLDRQDSVEGANDPRVPIGEAEQIVAGIQERGGAVRYLPFSDEGHGLVKLPNRIVGYTGAADFLDEFLRRDAAS